MKLIIEKDGPNVKEKMPTYRISLYYNMYPTETDYTVAGNFEELTPEIERFIKLLDRLEEYHHSLPDPEKYTPIWFGNLHKYAEAFDNPEEDPEFFRNFTLDGKKRLVQAYVGDSDGGTAINYIEYEIEYLDENGRWHFVNIED